MTRPALSRRSAHREGAAGRVDALLHHRGRLATEDAEVECTRKYQRWFIFFGLVPLTPIDVPREIIEDEKLVEVRVIAEDNWKDVVLGAAIAVITVGIFSPQTVIVEGNRAPSAAP